MLQRQQRPRQIAHKREQNKLSVDKQITMASVREQFEIPSRMKTWSMVLIAIGIIAFIVGLITKGMSGDEHQKAIFIGTLMYNSIFWMLICNASMFFICATTL